MSFSGRFGGIPGDQGEPHLLFMWPIIRYTAAGKREQRRSLLGGHHMGNNGIHHVGSLASGETAPDLLIYGGILLNMIEGEAPLKDVLIAVKDGRIAKIGKVGDDSTALNHTRVEHIDATRGIILPGLINAHTHAAMTLFRGYADDLPLKTWLFEKIFPLEQQILNPQTVYRGTLLGCLEMIGSGTTCFMDGYFFEDATIRAAHEAGLRAVAAQGIIDFPAPGIPDPRKNMNTAKEFLKKWSGFSTLIQPGLFCHSPVTCSRNTLEKVLELCLERSAPLQIHLSETLDEVQALLTSTGKRPVRFLEDIGFLNPRLVAAHVIHLDDEEIDLLAARSVKVVHLPESNMKLSSGIAPIQAMRKAGLSIGLGTDGTASNNDLDVFLEMDTAAKLAKISTRDPVCLNAREVLRMATAGGASVLGLENEIGTLEEGKRADIIVVDLDAPHLQPLYDPYSTLVYSAGGSDVKDVIVDGRVLMKDRTFMTLDPGEVMAKVRETAHKIRGI
jgi:5-methylthioadenosine/S-adenosylhomocysteine deaminase